MSSSAGIHDPYWYEATVGQEYLVRMLDPNSNIESVTFQKTTTNTLDDVVVKYRDGKLRCVQVKHSRVDSNFTFASMFLAEGDFLFRRLFADWSMEASHALEVVLYTNRSLGERDVTIEYEGQKLSVPSLEKCYEFITSNTSLSSNDEKISNLLLILRSEAGGASDERIIEFFKSFSISHSQPSLEECKERIQRIICDTVGCTSGGAEQIHARLDYALRKWVTTARGKEESVDREELLGALSFIEDEEVGQHEIPPPAPFFVSRKKFSQEIESKIRDSGKKFFFISGEAGSGKSSVVSYLCNRPNPAFDLRFHAFLPLQVTGSVLPLDSEKVVSPKVFWSDLLIQLRRSLKGQLASYNLPVLASALPWEEVRRHVLAALEQLAKSQARFVTVAIDGIDHAARSRMELTFLDTIPPPSGVSSGIKFILVGQPPASYPQYPIWIREVSEQVERFDVPSIGIEDIEDLLLSRSDLRIAKGDVRAAAIEIQSRVAGNTLSAVFAVEETARCESPEEVASCLVARKLTANLAEYYEEIWNATIQKIPRSRELVSVAAALVFSSFKTRATPEFMAEAFGALGLSAHEWIEVFSSLGPLIIKDRYGYRVLHNDVRIYLLGFANQRPDLLLRVSRDARDYLVSADGFESFRQNDLVNLVLRCGEEALLGEVVSDKFVFDGHKVGKPEDQIADEVFRLFKARDTQNFNLKHLLQGLLISKTMHSLDVSMSNFEIPKGSQTSFDGSFLRSECKVLPLESWSTDSILEVLNDAKQLIRFKHWDRAKALFNRWFVPGIGVDNFAHLEDEQVYEKWQAGEEKELSKDFTELARSFGFCAACAGRWDLFVLPSIYEGQSNQVFLASMLGGGLKGVAYAKSPQRAFLRLMRERHPYYPHDFKAFVETHLLKRNWALVGYLVKKLSSRHADVSLSLMIVLALAEIALDLGDFYTKQLLDKERLKVLWANEEVGDKAERLLCYLSAIYGIAYKGRPSSSVVEDLMTATDYRSHDEYTPPKLRKLMNLTLLASRSLIKGKASPGAFFEVDETTKLITFLFKKSGSEHRGYISDERKIIEMCMSCLSMGAQNLSVENCASLGSTFQALLEDGGCFWVKEWIISYFLQNDGISVVQRHLEQFLSGESGFWGFDPSIRTKFLSFLEENNFQLTSLNFGELNRKNRLGLFFPSSHKDYSLLEVGEALAGVLERNPSKWSSVGLKVLAVSLYYSELGDNRMHWPIRRSLLVAALRVGASDFKKVLSVTHEDQPVFNYNEPVIIEAVSEALKYSEHSEEDLVFIWEFCRAILPFGVHDTSDHLGDLRNRFLSVGAKSGFSRLQKHIADDRWVTSILRKEDSEDQSGTPSPDRCVDLMAGLDELKQKLTIYDDLSSEDQKICVSKARDALAGSRISKRERGDLLTHLQHMLLSKRRYSSLRHSGLIGLFEAVARAMSIDELVGFYRTFVVKFLSQERPAYWADMLRDDLSYFGVAFAEKLDQEDVFVEALVSNAWNLLSAYGEVKIPFDGLGVMEGESVGWRDFYVHYVLRGMACRYAELQLEAWKSFARMCFADHEVFRLSLAKWAEVDDEVKMKILGVVEASGWYQRRFYDEFAAPAILLANSSSQSVEIRVQAAICEGIASHRGMADFNFTYRTHEKFRVLPNGPDRLLNVECEKLGLAVFSNGYASFFSKMRMAKVLLPSIDANEVEKRVARYKGERRSLPSRSFMSNQNSILLTSGDSLDLLHEAIEDLIASGEQEPSSNAAFFQFVLNGDDPNLLVLRDHYLNLKLDPESFVGFEGLPPHQKEFLKDKVFEAVSPVLQEGEAVLAADASLYSRKHDVLFKYDLVREGAGIFAQKLRRPSSFGGRGSIVDSPFRLEPNRDPADPFLICDVGGICQLSGLTFFAYPKTELLQMTRLRSVSGSPFHFENDNGGRLCFQRVHLAGEVFFHTPYFRTSCIDMWVANKKLIEEIGQSGETRLIPRYGCVSKEFKTE